MMTNQDLLISKGKADPRVSMRHQGSFSPIFVTYQPNSQLNIVKEAV